MVARDHGALSDALVSLLLRSIERFALEGLEGSEASPFLGPSRESAKLKVRPLSQEDVCSLTTLMVNTYKFWPRPIHACFLLASAVPGKQQLPPQTPSLVLQCSHHSEAFFLFAVFLNVPLCPHGSQRRSNVLLSDASILERGQSPGKRAFLIQSLGFLS